MNIIKKEELEKWEKSVFRRIFLHTGEELAMSQFQLIIYVGKCEEILNYS
jgi:hypothetical protein